MNIDSLKTHAYREVGIYQPDLLFVRSTSAHDQGEEVCAVLDVEERRKLIDILAKSLGKEAKLEDV